MNQVEHLTESELTALLEAARIATPGPWESSSTVNDVVVITHSIDFSDEEDQFYGGHLIGESISANNRDFIALANPATIQRLVLMVQELQQEQKKLLLIIEAGTSADPSTAQRVLASIEQAAKAKAAESFRARAVKEVNNAPLHDEDCLYRTHNGACDCPQGLTLSSVATLIESLPLVETEDDQKAPGS